MTVHGTEAARSDEPTAAPVKATSGPGPLCKRCGADLSTSSTWERLRICGQCRYHGPLPARRRLDLLLDEGSFRETHQALSSVDPLLFSDRVPYSARLNEARAKTGLEEAVIVGSGRINGRECVLAVLEFEFMGGSMGTVVGEK